MKKWSSSWVSSSKPGKQRKYRYNAPTHVKRKLMSANLSKELRSSIKKRSVPLRTGDQVKVMRGNSKGRTGKVIEVNRDKCKVFVGGIEFEKKDGTKKKVGFDASKLMIIKLNTDDKRRFKKK